MINLIPYHCQPSGGPSKVASDTEENENVLLKPNTPTPTTNIIGNLKPGNDPVL